MKGKHLTILVVLYLAIPGCTTDASIQQPEVPPAYVKPVKLLSSKLQAFQDAEKEKAAYSRIVIFTDQSGSMETAKVAKLEASQLNPVLEKVEASGSEIAIAAICDRSDRPLFRVTFPTPPHFNPVNLPTPPAPLPEDSNPWDKPALQTAYQKAVDSYDAQLTEVERQIQVYEGQRQQHHAAIQKQAAILKNELDRYAKKPRNCQETDIQSAVERAKLFFGEPSGAKPVKNYAIFITDGLDSYSQKTATIPNATIYVVSGTPDIGIFSKATAIHLESPTAAFNQLAIALQPVR